MSKANQNIFDHSTLVQAGAGAGKTTELVRRVLVGAQEFRRTHSRWPRLCVTTFTRKATQELRERLTLKALEEKDPQLIRYVQNSSNIHISTIHGVLNQFLRRYGQVLGLTPHFEIISESQERQLFRKCLQMLGPTDSESDLKAPFESSTQLLLELMGHFDIYNLERILFSACRALDENPSLQALENADEEKLVQIRIEQMREVQKKFISTLENEPLNPKWEGFLASLRRAETLDELLQLPKERKLSKMSEQFDLVREEYYDVLESLKSPSCKPDFLKRHLEISQMILDVAKVLRPLLWKVKSESNGITQEDLELATLNCLREHPVLGDQFAKSWDYWFVDEFQDTSPRQVEILKLLRGGQNSFVVGDPQQSLYLFRGARRKVFEEVLENAKRNQFELQQLQTNYRSNARLLSFFNEFFVSYAGFTGLLPGRTDSLVSDEDPVCYLVRDLTIDKKEKMHWEVRQAIAQARGFLAKHQSVVILSRRNQDIQLVKEVSRELSCPIRTVSTEGLFDSLLIRDVLHLLRFLICPEDNNNLMAVLQGPLFEKKWTTFISWNGKSLWRSIQENPLFSEIAKLHELADEVGILTLWQSHVLQCSAFMKLIFEDQSMQLEMNLWKVFSQAQMELRKGPAFLLKWLQEAMSSPWDSSENNKEAEVPSEGHCLQAMTVHASKGLQFDHVILIGCGNFREQADGKWFYLNEEENKFALALFDTNEQKRIPSLTGQMLERIAKDESRLEMDRVLYVALTRARETVTMIWSQENQRSWADVWKIWADQKFENESSDSKLRVLKQIDHSLASQSDVNQDPISPNGKTESIGEENRVLNPPLLQLSEAPAPFGQRLQPSARARMRQVSWKTFEKALEGSQVHEELEKLALRSRQEGEHERNNYKWHKWNELLVPEVLVQLFQNGNPEWGFQVKLDGAVLSGQIDLWGIVDGELWIVDYKSGRILSQYKYWRQVSLYRQSLLVIFPEFEDLPWHLALVQTASMSMIKRSLQDFSGWLVFCDGAASGNPGPAGWGSIVCSPDGFVTENSGHNSHATNNQMELLGVIESLRLIERTATEKRNVSVYTDSTYVIKGITQWIHGWKKRGWKNMEGEAIANQPLWEQLDSLVEGLGRKKILWNYVRGHVGVPGNERCDSLAQARSKGKAVDHFEGTIEDYDVDLMTIPEDTSLPEGNGHSKSEKEKKASWYLSEVNGEVLRHRTWAECEARVKGRRARFKKVSSDEEEKSWLEQHRLSSPKAT